MRTLDITIGGKDLSLTASFAASWELSEKIADPMLIAREIATAAIMEQNNIPHTPRWKFSIDNVPKILHIGAKEKHPSITLKEVQELVFAEGFFQSQRLATDYLTMIIGPTSEADLDDEDKEATGEPGK